MISNKILQVLSSDKMTENPVNWPKVGDTTSRPVYGFRIVPTAERLKTKGSINKIKKKFQNFLKNYKIFKKIKKFLKN